MKPFKAKFHKSRKPITPNYKCKVGPGGIDCPCCTHGLQPTIFKRLTRRLERVFLKRELVKQVQELSIV